MQIRWRFASTWLVDLGNALGPLLGQTELGLGEPGLWATAAHERNRDDDGGGGGDPCAAAGWAHERREPERAIEPLNEKGWSAAFAKGAYRENTPP